MNTDFSPFINRRKLLVEAVKKAHPGKKGSILLLAGFESNQHPFRQDSSFYYFTGLEEPAVALHIDENCHATLYTPSYGTSRSIWASTIVDADAQTRAQWGIQDIQLLGAKCPGYTLSAACVPTEYEELLALLESRVLQGEAIFTPYASHTSCESLIIDRLLRSKAHLLAAIVDISPSIASLRRTKSQAELERIYEAIDCTMQAHDAAAGRIEHELYEYQIQAALEFIFKESGGSAAFPSIVASGKNSTTLHYHHNNGQLRDGDLVVVDIGAQINYYCADLTRTYPVSGVFTPRQREVYTIVLDTQQYIASIAQAGYWLRNQHQPDKSLHHLAVQFLKDQGYDTYFPHGIGHYLGLDVHDVGDYSEPLKEGDVITIEPGIYIPQEKLGIRIEDNYWVTGKGVVCLSEDLPRDSYEVEEMMSEGFDDE